MKYDLLRKLGISLLRLFISSLVVFVGVRALPGDTAIAMSSETSDPHVPEVIRQQYGV